MKKKRRIDEVTAEKIRTQCRSASVELPADDSGTLRFPMASEYPVERWFGREVLSHKKGAMVMGERQKSLPLLFNHDRNKLLGVVEKLDQENNRTYATVRFASTEEGQKAKALVDEKVLVNVSFNYDIHEYEIQRGANEEDDEILVTKWEVNEVSLVTIPADPTVGVYRSLDVNKEVTIMDDTTQTAASEKEVPEQQTRESARIEAVADQRREEAQRNQVREAERQRVAGIYSLCREFNIDDAERDQMIRSGNSMNEIHSRVLDLLRRRSAAPVAAASRGISEDLGLTSAERQSFSLVRALNAALTGDWSQAGFEREVSRAIAQRSGKETTGFFMPSDVSMRRDDTTPGYVVNTAAQGGNLVATDLRTGSFIELLRAKAMVVQMGATVISGLVGNIEIPRQSGASSVYWLTENGNPTGSNATFDKISLKPKTIGALSNISRNLLLQSSMNVEAFVRNELAISLGLGIDLAALCGSGTNNEPTGIANVSGICTVEGGTNGAALTFDHLIDMETQVATANADVSNMYYLCNAATIGYLKKIKDSNGDYIWKPITQAVRNGFPGEVNGYQVARSNQARSGLKKGTATNCSEIYFGNWSDLIIGEWGYLDIDVNRYRDAWASGGIEIRALQSLDIAVRHPKSFCLFSDALVS